MNSDPTQAVNDIRAARDWSRAHRPTLDELMNSGCTEAEAVATLIGFDRALELVLGFSNAIERRAKEVAERAWRDGYIEGCLEGEGSY